MPLPIDPCTSAGSRPASSPASPTIARLQATRWRAASALAIALWLSGCAAWDKPPAPQPPATAPATTKPPAPQPAPLPTPSPAPEPEPDPGALADAATRQVLAMHERLRALPAAELLRDHGLIGERPVPAGPEQAAASMERALLLMMVNRPQAGDLTRAVALLEAYAKAPGPWRAVAQLLLSRALEQRRLEEQLDKQGQQLREQQRRIEQLASQLEALKAIERSLNQPRPPAPAVAPRQAP